MISFAPDGDVNNFGGNIVATASTDIHGGVKGTNGIHGAHDEYPKSPSNAPPPKAMGPSYRRSNLESPVLLYSCRILALRLFNYIMGVLPSWWLGVEDSRPTESYMSAERWEKEVRDIGFSGTDSVIYDDSMLHQIHDNNVSSNVETTFEPREVTHHGNPKTSPISYQVEATFTQRDFRFELSTLGQMAPPA